MLGATSAKDSGVATSRRTPNTSRFSSGRLASSMALPNKFKSAGLSFKGLASRIKPCTINGISPHGPGLPGNRQQGKDGRRFRPICQQADCFAGDCRPLVVCCRNDGRQGLVTAAASQGPQEGLPAEGWASAMPARIASAQASRPREQTASRACSTFHCSESSLAALSSLTMAAA